MNDYPSLVMTTGGNEGGGGGGGGAIGSVSRRIDDKNSDPSVTFDMFATPKSSAGHVKNYTQPYYSSLRQQQQQPYFKYPVPSQPAPLTPISEDEGDIDFQSNISAEVIIPITEASAVTTATNERHRNVTTEAESTVAAVDNDADNTGTHDNPSNQRLKTINHGRSYKKKGKYCCCFGSNSASTTATTTYSKPKLLLFIFMCLLGIWWATTTVSLLATMSDISLFTPKSSSAPGEAGILLPLPDGIGNPSIISVVSKRETDHPSPATPTKHLPQELPQKPFTMDYMTDFRHAAFDKIVLDIILNEMSQPLNDYSWQLTIDISNATLRDKPLSRKTISSDHPSLVGVVGPWESRSLDLDNVFKKSVSDVLQVRLNVDSSRSPAGSQQKQQQKTMGGGKTANSNNKIYERELKEIMDDSLVRTIYRLIYESLDYRCCCYAPSIGGNSGNPRAKCGKKSTESKDSFEKELELLEERITTTKHATAPLEDWIYCKVKWQSPKGSTKQQPQHIGLPSSPGSELVLQFGTSSKLMTTLTRDNYRCSLQIMIDDTVRAKPIVSSLPPND